MRTVLMILALVTCNLAPAYAEDIKPSAQATGDANEASVDYSWEGKIDYLRPQEGEIVVGDRMFLYSTTTVISKRGQKAPVSPQELKPGIKVKVTPLLPIPQMGNPRALGIEIIP